jgi:hypothetical protein
VNEGSFSPSGSDTKVQAIGPLPRRPIVPQSIKDILYSRSLWSRCFLIAWVSAVLLGLGILLFPEGHKEALVRRDGWVVQGAFRTNLRPASGEISRNILKDPQSVFWTSWTPDTNGAPGRITSAPFLAPRVLAVPFSGYPSELGVELYLECLESGKRLRIAHGNAHYAWVERTIWLPTAWCDSDSRLVANSTRGDVYIGVGTPFRSSPVAWLKESAFVVVFVHALACVLLFGPGLAVASLARIFKLETALFVALPGTFLTGYIAFFGFYYGPLITRVAVILAAVVGGVLVFMKRRILLVYLNHYASDTLCRLFFGLSLSYTLLLYSADLGVGPFAANYRFAPAVWSTDNQLPQIVAEGLYKRRPIKFLISREWRVSDRPPLMSGLFLMGRPVWESLIAIGENARLLFYFYQITGILVSTLWVIPIWLLLMKSVKTSPREVSFVVIALAATGLFVFNSTYVWPKMLSGAFALAAYLAHTSAKPDGPCDAPTSEAAAGLFVALALLAHSGVVFGLVPLFVVFAVHRRDRRIRGLIVPIAVATLVVAPWLLWQRFEDPPGNALTKFALAGTFGFGEETKGLATTIREAYAGLSFREWLSLRWQAVLTIFGAFRPPLVAWLWLQPMDFLGKLRLTDFAFVIPSLGLGNLGWLVLVIALLGTNRDAISTCIFKSRCVSWVIIGLSGIALNVVLTWYVHIVHHQSYLSMLLMFVGLYSVLLLTSPLLRRVILVGQFAYFALVWLYSPLAELPWRYDHVAGWLLSVVGLSLAIPPASGASGKDLSPGEVTGRFSIC